MQNIKISVLYLFIMPASFLSLHASENDYLTTKLIDHNVPIAPLEDFNQKLFDGVNSATIKKENERIRNKQERENSWVNIYQEITQVLETDYKTNRSEKITIIHKAHPYMLKLAKKSNDIGDAETLEVLKKNKPRRFYIACFFGCDKNMIAQDLKKLQEIALTNMKAKNKEQTSRTNQINVFEAPQASAPVVAQAYLAPQTNSAPPSTNPFAKK